MCYEYLVAKVLPVATGDFATIKAVDLQKDFLLISEMYESWKKENQVAFAVCSAREEFFCKTYYFDSRRNKQDGVKPANVLWDDESGNRVCY